MRTLEEIKKILEEHKDEIRENYKAEVIGIFGSYTRGEQKESSDIDLIVRFEKGATLFDLVELSNFLEEKFNIKVDIVSERVIKSELKESLLAEIVRI